MVTIISTSHSGILSKCSPGLVSSLNKKSFSLWHKGTKKKQQLQKVKKKN